MLLTLVGLFNLFFCWPIVLLLKLAKLETLTILSSEYADIELSIKFLLSLVVASALGLGKLAVCCSPTWSGQDFQIVYLVPSSIHVHHDLRVLGDAGDLPESRLLPHDTHFRT